MPESAWLSVLSRVRRRMLARAIAQAIAVGGAASSIALIGAPLLLEAGALTATLLAVAAGTAASGAMLISRRRISLVDTARALERVDPSLDNLLVTAAELEERPRPVASAIRDEIYRQAETRARSVDLRAAAPVAQPLMVAAAVVMGAAILGLAGGQAGLPGIQGAFAVPAVTGAAGSFEVRVTPPAYSKREPGVFQNPVQVTVLAGSRVQIAAIGRDWTATESAAIEIPVGSGGDTRFLSVMVVPDRAPTIQIVTPGRDTAFAQPAGRVPIAVHSADDLGLTALTLRFTKASGGGESVSFTEGDVPLRIERTSDREWRGSAELVLDGLGLAEGDMLVYRAVTRDSNPDAPPVQSDQYVIEIGKNAEIADAGFALPTEEKKYAISQQMVIYRTEQLLKNRPADFLEESRGLAMEQRMVRAEVVFLSGGEVEDEVEEAAHSHELAEGRLENSGRAEMVRAINAMSRAEAQLNDGRAKEALVFEREALVHLERALDRRRYFLRTMPDRSRIDATRRLTGERREARSWQRPAPDAPAPGSLDAQQRVMRDLADTISPAAGPYGSPDARGDAPVPLALGRLAQRLAAIDPSSSELQDAAVTLASAATDAARREAARAAMAALTSHALRSLPPSSAVGVRHDPLAGRLADELRPRR